LQTICFKEHLKLCLKHDKTLIIHSRGAREETLKFLEMHAEEFRQIRFVWHCFTEDLEAAQAVIDLDGYIGIGGVATYPKSDYLRDIIKTLPLKHLLTETDAPFLIPHQARKQKPKLNSPAFIPEIIKTIAEQKKISTNECEIQLFKNAQKAFNLKD
jgi:TatD DNase family protein